MTEIRIETKTVLKWLYGYLKRFNDEGVREGSIDIWYVMSNIVFQKTDEYHINWIKDLLKGWIPP